MGIKAAPGSDAGAYRVIHGKGIRDEVQSFVEILGDQDAAYRWLAEGEAEIKKKFTVLFIGDIPRGVFCERRSQKTRDIPREFMRLA